MLELLDKDFKVAITTVFKGIKKNAFIIKEQIGNHSENQSRKYKREPNGNFRTKYLE